MIKHFSPLSLILSLGLLSLGSAAYSGTDSRPPGVILAQQLPNSPDGAPVDRNQSSLPLIITVGIASLAILSFLLFWQMRTAQERENSLEVSVPPPKSPVAPQPESPIESPAQPSVQLPPQEESMELQTTTRITTPDLMTELIGELSESDPKKRRKAIWEIAQKADSRAVKPLVDLMIDADSHERTLILEAISQVCSRTMKPMNHALAISLQDQNAQVRKNAIRDITKIYDLISQIRPLLYHATDDSDREVRETAQWALSQLNLLQIPSDTPLVSQDDKARPLVIDQEDSNYPQKHV